MSIISISVSISVTGMPCAISICADRLAEAAIADDDRVGAVGAAGRRAPRLGDRARSRKRAVIAHQERRRRHRQRDDRAEQARRLAARSAAPSCACANRTKPNSPPWLSSSPSASALRQRHPERHADADDDRRSWSRSAPAPCRSRRAAARRSRARSSIMPTARKNRPSRIERNGSTSASSSCRYGLSASITPAMNAPSAVDRPERTPSPRRGDDGEQRRRTTNISRSPRLPISRNSGRSR